MRDRIEIQRAHDILCAFILGELEGVTIDDKLKERLSIACDSLCWVLQDRCGATDTFAENLAGLNSLAESRGLSLKAVRTYRIDGETITCGRCGRTSHHPEDVKNRYCGNCHVFHDDIPEAERLEWMRRALVQ